MLSFAVVAATALVLVSSAAAVVVPVDVLVAVAATVAVAYVLAAVRLRHLPGVGVYMLAHRICFARYEDELYHLFVTFRSGNFRCFLKFNDGFSCFENQISQKIIN